METKQLLGTFSKDARGTRHLLTVPVHYEDTDFSGFVYHANYLKFAERGRSNFINLAGITHLQLLEFEPQLAFVVGHMEMDFLSPGRVEDLLLVETIFTECRGARLTAEQRISREGETLWQAHVLAAVVDLDGRPRRMPKQLAAQMTPHLGTSFLSDKGEK
ncbi:MAG: YbgC/FadM family acyl-CoA thioesterase [Parvibaculales bacterium]|jgi:acyl-CoA thioester hydrolase|nr:YbgC/FadM family acyl-CoA thioesterase [Alphaproteobacteria bacterium]|tara:strand:+ start:18 stop:500 length:483 start_codon:yes stop_codon:yes gene_type:complete